MPRFIDGVNDTVNASDPLPNASNLAYVEGLYEDFQRDPSAVPQEWRAYFSGMSNGPARLGPSFRPSSVFNPTGGNGHAPAAHDVDVAALQERVDQLVHAYRVRGHLIAQVDPLGLPRPHPPELELEFHGLTDEDLARPISTEAIHGADVMPLRRIIELMQSTYCRSIGAQYMHIDSLTMKKWLQERMESTQNHLQLSRTEQHRILTRLTDATIFEEFIQKKFIGAKSFSLEGAESLIPLLDLAIEKAGEQRIREVVLSMAHRGRLNVLANIMDKGPKQIFREFEDKDAELHVGRGDVKYHLGHNTDRRTASGHDVHVSLCFNPSHLEYVNPVCMGRVRAKQDRFGDAERERALALIIHGDAAFAGEGIVQESLNLSQLAGYTIGGALHVVVNNNIGFTTSPGESRSCTYATDVARMLQVPIFHVNGEDPEAVAQVVRLSMDFRLAFKRDVVIDMYCYRRLGHNESDEPAFTQPLMYQAIAQRKSVREGYVERLLALDGLTSDEADGIARERRDHLERELSVARSDDEFRVGPATLTNVWAGYRGGLEEEADDVATGVPRDRLAALLERLSAVPPEFNVNPKLKRFLAARAEMAAGDKPLDWAAAEALAFASLAAEGRRVRMTGQDCQRGTFTQRHAVLHDSRNGQTYCPLQHVAQGQAPVELHNSPLSEVGVLGFEYGYALDCPDGLTLWEAQFGDFVNCAQPIIDQFIVSGEAKWRRLSGIVLLLPHGFEGQGPEHSSARLERFLAQAAEQNIQVANPTTPAQYFHLLRRQVLRKWIKPLIVMTPKSLLRHPKAVSPLDELVRGKFDRIIPDSVAPANNTVRILLCSGKLYYELAARREELKRDDVAILRIEQLYPLAEQRLRETLAAYRDDTPTYWVQEEPENQGAWRFVRVHFGETLFGRLPFSGVYRAAAASPATGSGASHKLEQQELLEWAFTDVVGAARMNVRKAGKRK